MPAGGLCAAAPRGAGVPARIGAAAPLDRPHLRGGALGPGGGARQERGPARQQGRASWRRGTGSGKQGRASWRRGTGPGGHRRRNLDEGRELVQNATVFTVVHIRPCSAARVGLIIRRWQPPEGSSCSGRRTRAGSRRLPASPEVPTYLT
eukprot:5741111-Pyramimonas_sp.AAC.1